jgi:uncharacterized protein (TIGR00369 family)
MSSNITADPIPPGFKPRNFGEGFIGINGPLYARMQEGRFQLGFRVEQRHTNPMGICHGGMLATFADMLCPMAAHAQSDAAAGRFLPTISLQLDYLASAPLGSWVQGEAQLLRATRNMVFMQGLISADGEIVVRVSGVFKMGPAFPASMTTPQIQRTN